jgi:hypothetical protein
VAADAPRDHVLDLGGAGQVVERAAERAGRDVLASELLGPSPEAQDTSMITCSAPIQVLIVVGA